MAEDVTVQFGASIEKLTAGIAQATSALEGFAAPFQALQAQAGAIGEAIAAAFAVDKIEHFFESMAELGTQTERTAALLGVSTQAVSGLDIAAKASGGTLEGMTTSLERFGMALVKGDAGSKQQSAALAALGMSAKDFIGLPLPDALGKLADHFAVLKDGIDKDAIAMALMGRGGAQMIPIFNQGSAAFQEFATMAQRAGSDMSKETVAAFEETHLKLIELNKSVEGVSITMASSFKPAFDGAAKTLIDVVQDFNDAVKAGGDLSNAMSGLVIVAKGLATAFSVVVMGIKQIWAALNLAADAVYIFSDRMGDAIDMMVRGKFASAKNAITGLGAAMGEAFDKFQTSSVASQNETVTQLNAIWNHGAAEQDKIEQNKVGRMKVAAQDFIAAQLAAAQELIKIADMTYKQTAEGLNSAAKQFLITENQKTQDLLAAVDTRLKAELAGIDAEMKIHDLSKAQIQKIENDKTKIIQQATMDRQKIVDQAAEKEAATWKAGADQVAGAFNSQLKGLLAGTTTWAQAMKSITADLVLKMIGEIDKWAIEQIANMLRVNVFDQAMTAMGLSTHVAAEAGKTAATTAGAAARGAAEATGQSVGIFATIANAIKSIFASAGQTSAEVTAAVAPVAGPAAPAIGAAAGATTLASAMALVPSAAIGGYVLQSGLAMVHANETIVPAQMQQPYSGAGGGGDVHVHFEMNTIDARTGASFLMQNSRIIANAISKELRGNNYNLGQAMSG